MPLNKSITIPILSALICVAIIGGVLFWQLESARERLSALQHAQSGSGTSPSTITASVITPDDSGDVSLLHLRKGDVFALRSEWQSALQEYQMSVTSGGGVTAMRKLASAQLQLRDFRAANATLDQLRRAGARSEDVLLLESIIDLDSGELEKARLLLTAASDSPQRHFGLGLLSIVTGDNDTAKKELAATAGGWEPVLRSYANTLLDAYNEYALFPESPTIHLQTLLARALAEVQQCELALPLLSAVTHQQDDYRDAWITQGFCELTTARPTEALASLERAYQLDPEKPETQYFLGRAYSAQGDHGNALTFLQYALQNGFQPESEVRRVIAREALATGNIPLALDQEDGLTKLPDATIDTYTDYVTAAIASGKKAEALVKAQEAQQKWKDDAQALYLLGWAQVESGDKEHAKANLMSALQLKPDLAAAQEKLKGL